MAKINRFYQPVQQQYVSQFIPENLQLMQNALNVKQNQYDQTQGKLDLYEDELLKQQALSGTDKDVHLKGLRSDFEKQTEEFLSKDLSDPNVARDVGKFLRTFKNDPRVAKLNEGIALKKKHDELVEKYKGVENKYIPALDRKWLNAWDKYSTQTSENPQFASDLLRGSEVFKGGVDVYKAKEEKFNNIPEDMREELQSLSDGDITSYFKTGTGGRSKNKIIDIAKTEFDDFMREDAGIQQYIQFKEEFPDLSQKELEDELFKDFLYTGLKRESYKFTTTEASARNRNSDKRKEKEELDAKAMLSVGNTSLSNLGIKGFNNIDDTPKDPVTAGVQVAGSVVMDFITEMSKPDNERFNGKSEGEWLSDNVKANAEKVRGITQMSDADKQRFKTTAINFKNTLSDEQLKGFNKLSKEEKGKKLKEYIELMPKTSLELQGEVPLDPKRKALLNELVTFNSAANATVTPLDGESPNNQPTLDSYRQAGYKIVGRYVMKSNPVKPGERLAIVMEDESGNRVRVSTKGAAVLGENVDELIPSERNSYVSDNLQRQKFNYESGEFVIPINSNEYAQTSYIEGAEPQSGSIKGSITDDSYNISLNAFGQTFNAKWYFNEGRVPYARSDGNKAYANYKYALDEISDIYNTNESDEVKAANVAKFIQNLSNSQ